MGHAERVEAFKLVFAMSRRATEGRETARETAEMAIRHAIKAEWAAGAGKVAAARVDEYNGRVAPSRKVDRAAMLELEASFVDELVRLRLEPHLAGLEDVTRWEQADAWYERTVPIATEGLGQPLTKHAATLLEPIDVDLFAPTLDDDAAIDLLVQLGASWTATKKQLADDPATLWQLVLFRLRFVNGLLERLKREQAPDLIVKSVGSQNLTSDYDLTLSTKSGSGAEVGVIRAFNKEVKRVFKKQPGVVFDTNLYAKDFLPVKDTVFEKGAEDAALSEVLTMLDSERSDQDTAALTKTRQYLDATAWAAWAGDLVAGISDEVRRADVERRLEEVDATYLMKQATVLEKVLVAYDERKREGGAEVPAVEHAIEAWNRARGSREPGAFALAQEALEHAVAELAHGDDDLVLEARNELYLDQMQAVRALQERERALSTALATGDTQRFLDGLQKADRDAAEAHVARVGGNPDDVLSDWALERIDALRVEAKRLLADANFFAAEAYLSEGALQHVVLGNQSGNPAVLAKLKPEHVLESINEQVGDFLKDCGHYAGSDGEAFYQVAKYLQRMFEAIRLLDSRGVKTRDLKALSTFGWEPAAMVAALDRELLPIRGAKAEWATAAREAKVAAGLERGRRVYGVATLAELRARILKVSAEVNQATRALLTMTPDRDEQGRSAAHAR